LKISSNSGYVQLIYPHARRLRAENSVEVDFRKEIFMASVTRLALLALLCATPIWAQVAANKGIIVGTVMGPNYAAISDTKVTVVNPDTGLQRESLTNQDGQYWFGSLDPGPYRSYSLRHRVSRLQR
jgi:Carboxypeptidase regulatory-like domain